MTLTPLENKHWSMCANQAVRSRANTEVEGDTVPDLEYIGSDFAEVRIVGKLAEGDVATVYIARDRAGGCRVVKVLRPGSALDRSIVRRFFEQVRTARSLAHPGIVDIFDVGTDERGRPYAVMEYLHGETLEERLRRDGRLPVHAAVAIGRDVAEVLSAAHRAGRVHGRLDPSNVVLARDPMAPGSPARVKLLAFAGVGPRRRRTTGRGFVSTPLGVPTYMAPEQCRGDASLDSRADLYALGCLLYTLICGRPPFSSRFSTQVMFSHVNHPVAPPRMYVPAIDRGLERLLLSLLSKDPAQRPRSAASVAAELGQIARRREQAAAEVRDIAPDEGSPSWAKRARSWWRRLLVL